MKLNRNVSVVSIREFGRGPRPGTLATCISDLGPVPRLFGRLYADAADAGFQVKAPSGHVSTFYHAYDMFDREGETTAFVFKPVSASCAVREIVIFND